jgi:hypothetical protein
MLKIERLESQIIEKCLGAIKQKGPNQDSQKKTCKTEKETQIQLNKHQELKMNNTKQTKKEG